MGRRRRWPGGGFGGGGGRNPRIIDEASLQAVAEITGGQYYKAESADQLQEALGDLPSQVTVVTEARRHRVVVRRRRGIARGGRPRALAVVEPGTRAASGALRQSSPPVAGSTLTGPLGQEADGTEQRDYAEGWCHKREGASGGQSRLFRW